MRIKRTEIPKTLEEREQELNLTVKTLADVCIRIVENLTTEDMDFFQNLLNKGKTLGTIIIEEAASIQQAKNVQELILTVTGSQEISMMVAILNHLGAKMFINVTAELGELSSKGEPTIKISIS